MSEINNIIDVTPIQININDIFDKKIELGPLLQFNVLQKIIEEFINRQKKTDDKINEIEIAFNNITNNKKININNDSDVFNDLFLNNIYNETDNNHNNEDNINIDNNINNIDNNIKEINNEASADNNENIKTKDKSNKNVDDSNMVKSSNLIGDKNKIITSAQEEKIIIHLNSRINRLESKVSQLIDNVSALNKQYSKEFQSMKDKNNECDSQLIKIKKNIKELSEKVDDFNIFDMFKGDNNSIDMDKATILIKAVEQKLMTKISFSEKRNEKNEEMLTELKNEITQMKNANDAMYKLSNDIKNNYGKFLNDSDSKMKTIKQKFDEIASLKETIDNSVSKADLMKFIDEQNQKMNELLLYNSGKKEESLNGTDISKSNEINESLKSIIKKSIENSENLMKNYINNLNNDLITKEISPIKLNLNNKIDKENLDSINLKIEQIDEYFKTQIEDLKKDIIDCNDRCLNSIRIVENVRGQLLSINKEENKTDNESKNKNNNNNNMNLSEMELYLTKNFFDKEIDKLYKQMEKIMDIQSESNKEINNIKNKIKDFVSESDLTTIEQYLINLIDEYKTNDTKKYVDRIEYQKYLKYIEVQIKHLNDISTPKDNNENWLIAKKPLNNFMCASCEAYLGDLKNKDEYLAWNKIPIKDDVNRRYRLGHGFSKMLKMINKDFLKQFNRANSGLDMGVKNIGTKKIINNVLPKINIPNNNNISSLNNINNHLNSEGELNENLNNSADNIEHKIELKENNYLEKNDYSDRTLKNKSSTLNNSIRGTGKNNDELEPKVLKIYKKYKK